MLDIGLGVEKTPITVAWRQTAKTCRQLSTRGVTRWKKKRATHQGKKCGESHSSAQLHCKEMSSTWCGCHCFCRGAGLLWLPLFGSVDCHPQAVRLADSVLPQAQGAIFGPGRVHLSVGRVANRMDGTEVTLVRFWKLRKRQNKREHCHNMASSSALQFATQIVVKQAHLCKVWRWNGHKEEKKFTESHAQQNQKRMTWTNATDHSPNCSPETKSNLYNWKSSPPATILLLLGWSDAEYILLGIVNSLTVWTLHRKKTVLSQILARKTTAIPDLGALIMLAFGSIADKY